MCGLAMHELQNWCLALLDYLHPISSRVIPSSRGVDAAFDAACDAAATAEVALTAHLAQVKRQLACNNVTYVVRHALSHEQFSLGTTSRLPGRGPKTSPDAFCAARSSSVESGDVVEAAI